ncbi:ribosome small subunit-dependent GTPase A [Cohaesibacter gelatinilyticus]|uniref:Small ribosomal subunit biogenesis GTPase RsgA n=1 Tax=Cohaesibacter gelatinilyticus TaxID=372072 RepID=A0A285PE64_9HYPH|nr:ribosome small subunit-dependent GTPase A [Cohaesibacter gelatinilyticus]SNZ20025.1 ribosome biogenesis GTPase [Cohaesibacter gelatinilyticus]
MMSSNSGSFDSNNGPSLNDLGFGPFFMSQLDMIELETLTPFRISEIQRSIVVGLGDGGTRPLRTPHKVPTSAFAVGDWVLADEGDQITRRLDPRSELKRRGAGTDVSEQLMAANIDSLLIVTSCNEDFNLARIERFLALAKDAEVTPVVVLTKVDLCDNADRYISDAGDLMDELDVIGVNAKSPDALDALSPWCGKAQTLALVGSSGVGKTTLLNGLTGRQEATAAIRENDAKGRHTTTYRSLHPALGGAWVIDTPGIRALRLHEKSTGIEQVFDDIFELATQCKFNDCKHESEPKCAVQAAIASGELEAERLERWRKLEREDNRNTETIAQSRKRSKEFGKMVKSVMTDSYARKGRTK